MVMFGQVVIGPPGSGKTTFCTGMQMFLEALGRGCALINLDFANDSLPYHASIDVRDLITLESTMEQYKLGPNGGLVYCMEYLMDHIDWLDSKIASLTSNYIIFDCPGQVELHTHHTAVHEIINHFQSKDYRLSTVYLIDSYYCCDVSTFLSAVLVITSTMLRLALPHISILTKVDLLPYYGPLPFNLDFFTELTDLMPLIRYLDSTVPQYQVTDYGNDDHSDDEQDNKPSSPLQPFKKKSLKEKHRAMSEALCDTLNDHGLVSFIPLDIQNKELVGKVLAAVDRANGFSFATNEMKKLTNMKMNNDTISSQYQMNDSYSPEREHKQYLQNLFNSAARNVDPTYFHSLDIQEKYMHINENNHNGLDGNNLTKDS